MLAGVIALLALAATVASLGWLHVQPTGLSPVRNAVSQYGISDYKVGYRVATLAFGVAGVALAIGIAHRVGGNDGAVVALLLIFAAARAAISWFPMDEPGTTRTGTGRKHGLLAIAAFGGTTAAAFRLGGRLRDGSTWHSLAPVSTVLAVVMLACLLIMAFARSSPAVRERFGAVERGFYTAAIAWFTVFAAALVA
ncbi:MAG TPA: DUF998 domain-containing protein [Solirubrobacteraceae bacterium]|nr:DUF998 domain-containing protein [Solirubrobacteraceae bacterium]